jgi:hypothetical protein
MHAGTPSNNKKEMQGISYPSHGIHSLRWHYPNQVVGRNESVPSQPTSVSSPFPYYFSMKYYITANFIFQPENQNFIFEIA